MNSSEHHYGISQSDMYQLYAYGKRYQRSGANHIGLYLLYPANQEFQKDLDFYYEEGLSLKVRPVNLEEMEKPILGSSPSVLLR